jgi:chaperone modulatory protein CbpM
MNSITVVTGTCLGEETWLELEEFAVAPPVQAPRWRFGGDELARVRRIRRLQRDFEAPLQSVAVMLDLLDEIDRLHALLRQRA